MSDPCDAPYRPLLSPATSEDSDGGERSFRGSSDFSRNRRRRPRRCKLLRSFFSALWASFREVCTLEGYALSVTVASLFYFFVILSTCKSLKACLGRLESCRAAAAAAGAAD